MNMQPRNQYLKELKTKYLKNLKTKSKRERSKLLDEAEEQTKLVRKYLITNLKPKSNLDKLPQERKKG